MRPDLCRRCGLCCRCKKLIDGKVVGLKDYACPFWDRKTGLCVVYSYRFKARKQCMTLAESIHEGEHPPDCPYVAGIAGYKSVVHIWE